MRRALRSTRHAALSAALLAALAPRSAHAQWTPSPSSSWTVTARQASAAPITDDAGGARALARTFDSVTTPAVGALSLRHHVIVGGVAGLAVGTAIAISEYPRHCHCDDSLDGLVAVTYVPAGAVIGMESGALVYLGRRVYRHYTRKPIMRVPNEP
jgi:hypothetical protein